MPEANVNRLRRGHEAFSRGDSSFLTELVAPDVDWGTTGTFPGIGASYQGAAGVERWMNDVRSVWDSFDVSLREMLVDEDDLAVAVEHLVGRGAGSGVEVEMETFAVYWFDADRIVRRRAFTNRDEALRAASLDAG